MEVLGSGDLVEKICHWGQSLGVCSLTLFISMCFMVAIEDMISQLPVLYAYFHVSPAIIDSL